MTFNEGRETKVSVVALLTEAVASHCEECPNPRGTVSTHFMRRLLPDGQETTRHQLAQNQAKLLPLTERQPVPQLVQWNWWRWTRWRGGGTQVLTGLDMVHLLVARTDAADTTVPVAITPTR